MPTTRVPLPEPSAARSGWPWHSGAPEPPPRSGIWPRISVVTPSLDQGQFVEQAIRSVLLQGYPELEYVIVDGASRDGSLDVIRRYGACTSGWVSEPDLGQSDALRKGFARATGEILAWLNADDFYLPGALFRVADAWRRRPGCIVAGDVWHQDERSGDRRLVSGCGLSVAALVRYWEGGSSLQQPGLFFPRAAYENAGGVDVGLRHAMDYDLVCRMVLNGTPVACLGSALAAYREHPASKTEREVVARILETSQVSRRYWGRLGGVPEGAERRFVARALMGHARRSLAAGRVAGAVAAAARGAWTDGRVLADAFAWTLRAARWR